MGGDSALASPPLHHSEYPQGISRLALYKANKERHRVFAFRLCILILLTFAFVPPAFSPTQVSSPAARRNAGTVTEMSSAKLHGVIKGAADRRWVPSGTWNLSDNQISCPKCHNNRRSTGTSLGAKDGVACIECPQCRLRTRSRNWTCSCTKRWFQCDIHALMLPHLERSHRRQIAYCNHARKKTKKIEIARRNLNITKDEQRNGSNKYPHAWMQ